MFKTPTSSSGKSKKVFALFSEDEGVYLNHIAVTRLKAFVNLGENIHDLVGLLGNAKVLSGLAKVVMV